MSDDSNQWFYGVIFIIIGLLATGWGIWAIGETIYVEFQSDTVKGEVVETSIEEDVDRTNPDNENKYIANIQYKYEYENQEYINDNMTPSRNTTIFDDWDDALEFSTEEYSFGDEVEVTVMSNNPENSFLDNSNPILSTIIGTTGGLIFVILGYLWVKKEIKYENKEEVYEENSDT